MAFTGPTDEVGVQPNVLPFSYECSGTVSKGQGVVICGDMQVKAPAANLPNSEFASGCVGVAEYAQTDGDWIAVYGPGAIVRVIISGANKCGHGQSLICGSEGKWTSAVAAGTGWASGVRALALEDQNTANGTARVLLV
jgi:hypothetical protein